MTNSNRVADSARDPVCGMTVQTASSKHQHEHAGRNYYFCCASCAEKFKDEPEKYLNKPANSGGMIQIGAAPGMVQIGGAALKPQPAAMAAIYVCPMCPEVRSAKPGPCPKCGMALEPETPVASTRTEYTCPMHPEVVRQ